MPPREEQPAIDPTQWDVSVCGLNCARCGLKQSGQCAGCRGPVEKNWSGDCTFRTCAAKRGLEGCWQCSDLPCEPLRAFAADGYEHHKITVDNLQAMKREGFEKWIARQEKVMFCPGWNR